VGKIYVDQTNLIIDLDTGIDLTSGVTSVAIKYTKPGIETVGEWDADVYDTTHIRYTASAGEIDTEGIWTFWSYIYFSDDTEAPGEPGEVKVYLEGR